MENFTAPERETIIRWDDESQVVHIWTAQRAVITKMSRNPAFTLESSGSHGTSPWAEFTIPVSEFRFGAKRVVTESQRQAARERAKARGWGQAS